MVPVTEATSLLCEMVASSTIGLFTLPAEIIMKIYRLALLKPVWQILCIFQDERSRVLLGLLYTNKRLCNETSLVWYKYNYFNFVDTFNSQFILLEAFLSIIRSVNVCSLSRICVNFPTTEAVSLGMTTYYL